MRIIFMGSPKEAATCLQTLLDAQEQIVCVVTQPDRKKGRGQILEPTLVKSLAEKYRLPIETPEKVKTQEFVGKIKSYNPDLIIVAAYGRILPKEILDIPKYGAINVHASLLPKYRGAAPIQWAILNGEKKTGITIMQMDETLDTGDIILQKEMHIEEDDTAPTLSEKLFIEGADLLLEAIRQIKMDIAKRTPQNSHEATYAALITKELGEIDWKNPAQRIYDKIRALIPWPCAYTNYNGKLLKILGAGVKSFIGKDVPGKVFIDKNNVSVACVESALLLKTVQLEGGNPMPADAFARGHNLASGKILPS